jgi:multidrug efflux pump subunit AcrA (membrane-fusion protein)
MASGSQPAVWVVDPATKTASLRPIVVGGFEAGKVVVWSGIEIGERVVTDGGKLLSRGQAVDFDRGQP